MLEALKQDKKVIGIKQVNKALTQDQAKVLYLAQDAEIHLTQILKNTALDKNIEIIYIDSMRELGKACGIDVSAAAAAILK